MNDLTNILTGLNDPSAKRREHSIKALTRVQLQEPQVVDALQKLVSGDLVEYVRIAARDALVSVGQVPAPSVAPIKLRNTNSAKIALLVSTLTILGIALCVILFVLYWTLIACPHGCTL